MPRLSGAADEPDRRSASLRRKIARVRVVRVRQVRVRAPRLRVRGLHRRLTLLLGASPEIFVVGTHCCPNPDHRLSPRESLDRKLPTAADASMIHVKLLNLRGRSRSDWAPARSAALGRVQSPLGIFVDL